VTRPLLIGLGNPLRGDDGLGAEVIRQIVAAGWDVEAVAVPQLTPEWAEAIGAVPIVVFVDAACGPHAGSVACCHLKPTPLVGAPVLTHHWLPSTVLALADVLYGRCPPAYLVTVTGARFDMGTGLSDIVDAAIGEVLRVVWRLVADRRNDCRAIIDDSGGGIAEFHESERPPC
jgi:hydrogenase maturation protease